MPPDGFATGLFGGGNSFLPAGNYEISVSVLFAEFDLAQKWRESFKICELGSIVCFADPYCSGQKGAIENMNKILREFFPKGTDFRLVTKEQLNRAQYQINERPRKILGFSTPKIEFFGKIC